MSLFGLATQAARRAPRGLVDFMTETVLLRWGFFRHPLRRRVVLGNFRRVLAFAGKPAGNQEARALLEKAIPCYASLLVSMLTRPEDEAFARERLDARPMLEAVARAREGGKGAIVALSNFGRFAHALMALFQNGVPIRVPILRRASVAHLPHGWAGSFLTVGEASKECLAALSRNEVAVVITMVNYMARRPTLELFGAPARLGYAPAALAVSSGAPILPVFTVEDGGRWSTQVAEPLAAGPGEGVEALTARLARVQERWIARYPHLWHIYEDFWSPAAMDAGYRMVRRLLRWF